MADQIGSSQPATPWNKGKLIGQKPPLRLQEIWSVRTRLQMAGRTRELALFNLALDSKLRGCDLVRLRVRDVAHGEQVLARISVVGLAAEGSSAGRFGPGAGLPRWGRRWGGPYAGLEHATRECEGEVVAAGHRPLDLPGAYEG